MRKRAFVPATVNSLEDRIAPSGGVRFIHGAAVLTTRAYVRAHDDIGKAYKHFAQHGQNFNRLGNDLAKAVGRIPFNVRDGLRDAMRFEMENMRADIQDGAPTPVINARQNSWADLKDFVQSEVADGTIVVV
jgi:hypothetical protein